MAPPLVSDALSGALDSSTSRIGAMVDQARERIRERARDAVRGGVSAVSSSRAAAPTAQPPLTPKPLPSPQGDHPIAIRLRNGRNVQAVLTPAVARRSDLEALSRASAENDRRCFSALRRQRDTIHRLARTQRELAAKVEALQKRADDAVVALSRGMAQSSRQLRQVAEQGEKLLAEAGSAAKTAAGQLQQQIRTFASAQQAQNLTNVIGTAQATAYGDHGSVLSRNNVLLTGNQLLWTMLPTLSRAFGGSASTSMLLGWLAPLGTLVAGYAAVGSSVPEREPQRFITGIEVFEGGQTEDRDVPLRDRVPGDVFDRLRNRTDVPVTVTLLDATLDSDEVVRVAARVEDGTLKIRFLQLRRSRARVAWLIDTGVNGG
jgi:hypothetical protein